MQVKIIELVGPSSIAFTCKDGIDVASPQCVSLFILLKLINHRPISTEEQEYIKLSLYAPCVLLRGRNLFVDRFTRACSMTKVIESAVDQTGEKSFYKDVTTKLAPLFNKDILSSVIAVPQPLL